MTIGVGGKTFEQALSALTDMTAGVTPISDQEFESRIAKAQRLMAEQNMAALYLNAGSSLFYFTGTRWNPSERMVGAVILPTGNLVYICPDFEKGTLEQFMRVKGEIVTWEEHETPYHLLRGVR